MRNILIIILLIFTYFNSSLAEEETSTVFYHKQTSLVFPRSFGGFIFDRLKQVPKDGTVLASIQYNNDDSKCLARTDIAIVPPPIFLDQKKAGNELEEYLSGFNERESARWEKDGFKVHVAPIKLYHTDNHKPAMKVLYASILAISPNKDESANMITWIYVYMLEHHLIKITIGFPETVSDASVCRERFVEAVLGLGNK